MMIAVIGQHEQTTQLDTMPWDVDRLENGSLRVFNITLGKTLIQEANQIFARFGKTQLLVTTDVDKNKIYQLITTYDELIIGGLIAKIELTYQVTQEDLKKIMDSLENKQTQADTKTQLYSVNKNIEMQYLNTPVASIIYIPSIDYGLETIRQNFGQAAEENQLNNNEQLWYYPEMGLQIYIHKTEPDQFIYAPLK
ncbi:hypothetical protein MNBD_GAMMA08-526 [hydrothermal vent metagenome]|uniref:Uncharacterized protein n=1 Tax=hydrothermal vent metagenome TaxID=652676 RepID=A0A3B0XQJ6_9ZZZZ